MTSPLYSYNGSRDFGSPSATLGGPHAGIGWADASVNNAFDLQDEVVNGALKNHSSHDSFSFAPEVQQRTRPPSLSTPARVNAGEGALYRKAMPVSQIGGGDGPQRSRDDLRLSVDALQPTESDSPLASPKLGTGHRERSADRYAYYGLLSVASPTSEVGYRSDDDRLPFLSSGSVQRGAARGDSASFGYGSGSAQHTTTSPLPSAYSTFTRIDGAFTAGKNFNDFAEVSRHGSAPSAPPPLRSTNRDGHMGTLDGQGSLYGEVEPLPLLKGSIENKTASRRTSYGKDAARLNRSGAAAPGSRSTTLSGLPESPEAAHTVTHRHTHFHGATGGGVDKNSQRKDAGASLRASTSIRSVSSISRCTQSDGDLRWRSRSRNTDRGSPDAPLGSSPERLSRASSAPSPVTDEDNEYFLFGLTQMPSVRPCGTTTASRSPVRMKGVVEASTSVTSRFKAFSKAPSAPPRQKPATAKESNAPSYAVADSPAAAHPSYDLSFIHGFGDGEEGGNGAGREEEYPFDYSTLAQPPPTQQSNEIVPHDSGDDVLKDGDYGDLMGAAAAVPVERTKTPSTTQQPSSSLRAQPKTNGTHMPAPQPATRKPAAGLSTFRPLSVATGGTPTSTAPAPLERRTSPFEPVPMTTSAMSASGRRFSFDGPKSESAGSSTNQQGHLSQLSPPLSNEKSGSIRSPVGAEKSFESPPSLSWSTSTRTPRPPSQHAGNSTVAAAMGDVVKAEADTAPSAAPTASLGTATTTLSDIKSGGADGGMLPPIVPASRRSAQRPSTTRSTTPPAKLPSPSHHRVPHATASDAATKPAALTDASLSPIASDNDSVDSIGANEQNALLHNALRQAHGGVLIRTTVAEADLLPSQNEPWPLRPPPPGIMITHRVFDPQHPRPRRPKMRELPGGKRQANWAPPETHYSTTLADLAAYEDEEDLAAAEDEEAGAEQARLRAIQDFEDDIWAGEDARMPNLSLPAEASPDTTAAAASASASASSPLRPLLQAVPLSHSPSRAPSLHSSELSSSHKSKSPVMRAFTPPPTAAAASPSLNVLQHAMDGSFSASVNPTKLHGGIVVDEVEKVRRMREDAVFTPALDDVDSITLRQTPLSVSAKAGSSRASCSLLQADVSSSPAQSKSPVLVPRGFNQRPMSPVKGEEAPNNTNDNKTLSTSGSNRVAVGRPSSLSENNRHSSHSVRSDSVLTDSNGNSVLPRSTAMPTFARIISQRSDGGGGGDESSANRRGPPGSPGPSPRSTSRDSLFSESTDRKSAVTFAEDEPESNSMRRR
ncbi:hypothetical protein ABB37_05861 [Leptomonas pyrrhocoris]|uniref:Uncharacterized protein n=1 Tax=Leptomonas pyrrhocoris TaxID=157538 RepID=A0A0M9FYI6_LEPPY|nr:hypothetical protein ABB37_05861 [Leptomonas pyrrhocoris]KPA78740.1 hypothetical protein ABB37_05861 [Leptomonas pyrrhocoris]|eukprot:XP_015657179.1 hypothetical protein ABB37_05861 [Leptomonas pyrrhocoris]